MNFNTKIIDKLYKLVKSDMCDEKLSNLPWQKWLKVFGFKAGMGLVFAISLCAIIWFIKH